MTSESVSRFVLPFTCKGRRAWSEVQQGPYVALQFSGSERDSGLLLVSLKINARELVDGDGMPWGYLMPWHFARISLPVLRFSDRIELAFDGDVTRVDLICRLADE